MFYLRTYRGELVAIDHSTSTQQDEVIHAAIEETLYPSVAKDGVLTYHEDYTASKDHLELVRDAYNSDGGFLDIPKKLAVTRTADGTKKDSTGYLDYFSIREDEDRYELRRKRAYFVSLMRTLVSIPVTYITTTGIHRNFEGLPEDPRKTVRSLFGNWDESIKFLMTQAMLYGVTVAGIDRASKKSETKADDKANPPKLHILTPLQIPDWDITGDRFDWLKHYEPSKNGRGNPMKPHVAMDNVRIWTPDTWALYAQERDKNNKLIFRLIDSGRNGYGEVPFRPLWSSPPVSGLYGSKESWQVAKVNRRAFNLTSETDDQLVGCWCNILTKPEIDAIPTETNAGPSTVLAYDPQLGGAPAFIAPSPEPIEVGFKAMDRLQDYCYQIMRLSAANRGNKPATAVQRLFESEETNKVVRDLAQQAEAFERHLLRLFLKVSGHEGDYEDVIESSDTLHYPENYNLEILNDNRVDRLGKLFQIPWVSKRFRCELEKHAATTTIPLSEDAREKVLKEVTKAYEKMPEELPKITPEVMQNPEISKSITDRLEKPITDKNAISSDTGGTE